MDSASFAAGAFKQLGLKVFERGWLSSNNILFAPSRRAPATVVDTGYVSHAEQTLALLASALGPVGLERVINTHLHSDHVGGNSKTQAQWNCETLVPEASLDPARRWDESRLSYVDTGQRCPRFRVDSALAAGKSIVLADYPWQAWSAPGHDPDALLLFQADSGVMLSGDALWEQRLAIIFPALEGEEAAFGEALAALDLVEQLAPKIVIPGHGRVFTDVAGAVKSSRERLHHFLRHPERHLDYAERALLMFNMLEHGQRRQQDLVEWLSATPVFQRILARRGLASDAATSNALRVIDSLAAGGQLHREDEWVMLSGRLR
ncbi:MBL fold metallo-hydrolase [Rubrivivax gelatinosus]|uniref:Glyoxylase-like metal-dependent hydrolase (Beta-lactamase superfamily II) n=1 Tax=Rubrivivax gelatinosus TaxID=28068 RepID=A0A4R2M900_RUBGE|nr:MBL fold metallo-hydrolase [Rubrivivax gelatinosus]MBK1688450.1 hypothetical protein [Rubrivivax gelatinosus]TCP00754.1 glyoxylase-like metal-dependent hydrolase (beta-lactamase superfamily II) [Rubrivivax gelatinosus]